MRSSSASGQREPLSWCRLFQQRESLFSSCVFPCIQNAGILESPQGWVECNKTKRFAAILVKILPRRNMPPLYDSLELSCSLKGVFMKKVTIAETGASNSSILCYARVVKGVGSGKIHYQVLTISRLTVSEKFSAYAWFYQKIYSAICATISSTY